MKISINQLLHISLDGSNYIYKARVADIKDNLISIEAPFNTLTGDIKVFSEGIAIYVWFSNSNYGQVFFKTTVKGILKEQVKLLLIESPKNIKRIQRRDYLRVSATLETSIRKKNQKGPWEVVKTSDISGGGLQLTLTDSNLQVDEEIDGYLILPFLNGTIEHIKYAGKVIRTVEQKQNQHIVSVQFTDIGEFLREKLIRFCYEKQVEMRKKVGDWK